MTIGRVYDPLALVCASHAVRFARYSVKDGCKCVTSHGCPVCVGLVRARVRLEKRRFADWRWYNAAVRRDENLRRVAEV